MHFPESLATLLDMKIDNKGYESDVVAKLIEMHGDLETKALLKTNLIEY